MVLLRGRRRGCVILLLSVCLCPSVACVAFVSHRSPVSYVSEQTSADASSCFWLGMNRGWIGDESV